MKKFIHGNNNKQFTFIDLFAGIGGFHLAFHNAGANCVFASEWDKYARKTYKHNFVNISPELFNGNSFGGDITQISASAIPDFDILTAGFPCQAFSIAGLQKGFQDSRGTMFFEIVRIIRQKKPAAFFLENVKHFLRHDDGKTFAHVKAIIEEDLGYSFHWKIVRACDFGLPN
jgi:DNA (cytosine-5)-methyltransferase 1